MPDSSLAGIIAAVVIPLSAGDPARAISLAGALSIITGALCIAGGLLKFGFLTDLLSKPVRYGYVNGIALTVFVGQLPKLFGFSVDADGLIDETRAFVQGVLNGDTNTVALLIGGAALAIILGFKRWLPSVPGVLVAVVNGEQKRRAEVYLQSPGRDFGSPVGIRPTGVPRHAAVHRPRWRHEPVPVSQ
jgi:MFS superfamily sulfate permease-like transporter